MQAILQFLGLTAKDAQRSVYNYESGSTRVPDPVAQLVCVAERIPNARLLLAGELSRRAALASIA